MKCRECEKEMGEGEANEEYCDGVCPQCYGDNIDTNP